MAAQVVAAAREDGVQLAVVEVQRDEHGGVRAAVDLQRAPPPRGRAAPAASSRGESARERDALDRSSNMTSPSSVRCTGHLAAMILQALDLLRRVRCSGSA